MKSKNFSGGVSMAYYGDTEFGFSFLPHLGNGNVVFSPFSIRTALSMVYEGARGKTAEEISKNAFIYSDSNQRWSLYENLMGLLTPENECFKLKTANGLWIDNKFEINANYQKNLQDFYMAQVSNADFLNNAEGCRQIINDWVSEKTEQKIPKLFPENSMDEYTVAALVNALYFKGEWDNKFNIKFTQKQDFTLSDGKIIQVDMMRKGAVERKKLPPFLYSEFDGVQAVVLPYIGNKIVNLCLLPPENSNISELEKFLRENPKSIEQSIYFGDKRKFSRLEIPKHESRKGFSLNAPLQKLGIKQMFDKDFADLKGMGKSFDRRNIYIANGFHEAYLKTNEEGSEGAAATGFAAVRCMSFEPEKKNIEFIADRPFLELIIHNPSSSLLFLNRIENPNEK